MSEKSARSGTVLTKKTLRDYAPFQRILKPEKLEEVIENRGIPPLP